MIHKANRIVKHSSGINYFLGKLEIKYINIQGLTHEKFVEVAQLLDKEQILILTETHLMYDRIKHDPNFKALHKMRDSNDKKGGGICLITRNVFQMEVEEIEVKNSDIMYVKMENGDDTLHLVTVYMSVINKPEDKKRNIAIQKELESITETLSDENLLIIGNFNGHIAEIGYQKENYNGKIMKSFVDRHNLSILNLLDECSGKITWSRGIQYSTIDYMLANENLLKRVISLNIDDNKEVFDLSDHHMMKLNLNLTNINENNQEKNINISYLSYKENDLKVLVEKIKEKSCEISHIEDLNRCITEISEQVLRKSFQKKRNGKVDQPWFSKDIEKSIKLRQALHNVMLRQMKIQMHLKNSIRSKKA